MTALVGRKARGDDDGDEPGDARRSDTGDTGETGETDESGGVSETGETGAANPAGPGRRFGRRRAGKHADVSVSTDDARVDERDSGRTAWWGRGRSASRGGDRPSRRIRGDGGHGGDGGGNGGIGGSKRRRPARRVVRVAVQVALALTFAGIAYVTVTFLQVWEASRTDDVRASDAIVVLGAAQYDCEPSPVLRSRLDHALELYRDQVAPRIVVTGGRRALDRCTEAKAGADYLRGKGVPDDDIMLEVKGRNTWESIAASANFLTKQGYTRVVLVTDDYHALRVRAIADELGLEPVVSPVGDNATFRELARETGAVAVGRVVGFRRLVQLDDRLVVDPGS